MRIASYKTLKNNKKTRIAYALNAMERDSLSEDKETQDKADRAMDNFRTLTKEQVLEWALREQDYRLTVY